MDIPPYDLSSSGPHPTHITHAVTHPTHFTPTVTHPTQLTPTVTPDNLPYNINMTASTSSLAEMLNNIDALDVIPKLQVETYAQLSDKDVCESTTPQIASATTVSVQQTTPLFPPPVTGTSTDLPTAPSSVSEVTCSLIRTDSVSMETPEEGEAKKKSRVGRPRTKPQKEKTNWHYHLGGVRHSRTPLTPELREVLEVAYVSKIMSKNFRKEGQPEKERIARITGMELEKVQEWFKNRRKKDKLLKARQSNRALSSNEETSEEVHIIAPQTLEQVNQWFKNRRKKDKLSKPGQSKRAVSSNEEAYGQSPLTVEPGFLEIQTSEDVHSITPQSLDQVNPIAFTSGNRGT